MKIKTKIICLYLMMAMVISLTGIYVFAVTRSELNDEKAKINSQISQKEDEISEINGKISASVKEVQSLSSQISAYESTISELTDKIDTVSTQITETETNINQKEKDLNDKQELLDKRLVAMYESGNTSYIDLLLSSADISDFISKYYLISEVAEYDTDLMNTIRIAKQELEAEKVGLEENKTSLQSAKQEQIEKQEELKNLKAEKQKKVNSLNAEEKELEHQLEILEEDRKDVDNRLAELARQEAAAAMAPSAYGYIFPVQGLSKANINNPNFPSYAGHTGVDINRNVTGKSVVAVKDGTVVISEARRNANGSYRSYGEYVVINHHDGTMTLYAHMLSGSRTVSPGQKVSRGQVIGTVGSTGNSTGNHLHFEVRLNNKIVNPIPYLPG